MNRRFAFYRRMCIIVLFTTTKRKYNEDDKINMENKTENKNSEEKKGFKAELISWIQIIATAVVIAFVLNTFIIANSDVPSDSMENTIMTGSRIIGSRVNYHFTEPERGDIAIFVFGWQCPVCHKRIEGERPDVCPVCDSEINKKGKTVHYVKRIIGIPGDIIDIHDGEVYLNGSETPLDEPYLREKMEPEESLHFEVPEDSYFMMGDNRNNSFDGRYWKKHFVSKEKITAKVLFEYFPKIKVLH